MKVTTLVRSAWSARTWRSCISSRCSSKTVGGALGLRYLRQFEIDLLLRALDAAFHIANRLGVAVEQLAVPRAEIHPEPEELVEHCIQDARLLPEPRRPGGTPSAAAVPEEPLEDSPGVVLHRHRFGRAPPGNRMRVDAAQVRRARSGVGGRVHRELERRQLRVTTRSPGKQLVDGDVGQDFQLVAPAARYSRQEGSRRTRMRDVPVRTQSGENEHPPPEGRQRLEDRGQLEVGPEGSRRPVGHRHPVGNVKGLEPVDRLRRPVADECRSHGVQVRESQGGPRTPEAPSSAGLPCPSQSSPPAQTRSSRPLRDQRPDSVWGRIRSSAGPYNLYGPAARMPIGSRPGGCRAAPARRAPH